MEYFTKCLFFSALIAATYARYVSHDRNILEMSDDANCSCDWRYFKHYETKGCVVETEDSCGCPQKFSCLSNQTQLTPAKGCIYKNKEYKVGSKIITSNVCQACRCRDGISPQISCRTTECFNRPVPKGDNCHRLYKKDKCCSVGYECIENESGDSVEVIRSKTCEYNGQIYPFGSKIYPEDDPCQICICNENWNGVDNSSCYELECMFEKHKSKLDAGCIPVYHERSCCPIEFYCPPSHNLNHFTDNESENYNTSHDNHCIFAGDSYELGGNLSIGNPCVKCTCAVPPDFTCVHQSCPPPPSKENCYRFKTSGECCPTYECMVGDGSVLEEAEGCPTPLCADSSCRIGILPGHECPTCICRQNVSELEHNNLEQVQQISQNVENMEQAFETIENNDGTSEEELQMMPLRMQDSEGQFSIMEKMILPEEIIDQYSEGLRELEESSNEDNSSMEAVYNVSKELMSERSNSTFLPDPEFNDTLESFSNQSDKAVQKRSEVYDLEINEDIEREGVGLEGNDENFDELENFKKKRTINELVPNNDGATVPPGCPTPVCEGPWCIVAIPPGRYCPTCICKRYFGNEP